MNSIASKVTGDKSVRRCDKFLYASPKSAENILTTLNLSRVRTQLDTKSLAQLTNLLPIKH